jgi:hypothetical protein
MATNTPTKAAPNATQNPKLPPEEKFWQRYSPHQEMPVSAASSFALHLLVIGGLVMLAWLGWLGFRKPAGKVEVEPVRFALPGGGGGKHSGSGDNPGIGQGADPVATESPNDPNQPVPDQERPKLDPRVALAAPPEVQKDPEFKRLFQSGNPNLNIFSRVDKNVVAKLRDGLNPGQGRGGSGKDGGKGSGTGTGEGDARGDGPSGALTQREKRMLRWAMIFDTRTGHDYLNQLRTLGAILAIPTGADGKSYKIVRDLSGRGPAKLLDEDVSSIQRIFWIDDRPESVDSVMLALQCKLRPNHFVAFMPPSLEEELFQLEKKYKGRSEDQIHETKFRIVPDRQRGYRPVVTSQTPK